MKRSLGSVVSRPDYVSRFPRLPHYTRADARVSPDVDGAARRAHGGRCRARRVRVGRCGAADSHPDNECSATPAGDGSWRAGHPRHRVRRGRRSAAAAGRLPAPVAEVQHLGCARPRAQGVDHYDPRGQLDAGRQGRPGVPRRLHLAGESRLPDFQRGLPHGPRVHLPRGAGGREERGDLAAPTGAARAVQPGPRAHRRARWIRGRQPRLLARDHRQRPAHRGEPRLRGRRSQRSRRPDRRGRQARLHPGAARLPRVRVGGRLPRRARGVADLRRERRRSAVLHRQFDQRAHPDRAIAAIRRRLARGGRSDDLRERDRRPSLGRDARTEPARADPRPSTRRRSASTPHRPLRGPAERSPRSGQPAGRGAAPKPPRPGSTALGAPGASAGWTTPARRSR